MVIRQAVMGFGVVVAVCAGIEVRAEDWPEFRGKGRLGVWNEAGLIQSFPEDGLKVRWRTPLKAGYSGPAVVDGRVFVTDFEPTEGMRGIERALALDEVTGEVLWIQEWEADYAGILNRLAELAFVEQITEAKAAAPPT